MGREIRRVPKGWSHPKENGKYVPLFDKDYESAVMDWKQAPESEFEDLPKPEWYRPKFEDAAWFQMYETVSEGTPVSPPFETKAEIVEYLVTYGDFWDQKRGDGGWAMDVAENFVKREFAFSGAIVNNCYLRARDGA